MVQNVISYWLFLSEQLAPSSPPSHLSFTETCKTWNKLKEPPEPFEPEGAGRVHANLHVNNYIYIKMFIVRPSPPVWRFWVVCIWLHLVTKMCVWVELGWNVGGTWLHDVCGVWWWWKRAILFFVFFCKLFTLPGYSGCMSCARFCVHKGALSMHHHTRIYLWL